MNTCWKGSATQCLSLLVLPLLVSIVPLLNGCEIGANPVILDGSPTTQTLRVDNNGAFFGGSGTVNLSDAFSGVEDQVDSVRIFNITLSIDSTVGTPPGTSLTGLLILNTDTLFTLNGTSLSEFSTERTIFDPKLKQRGCAYSPATVGILQRLLNQNPHPSVTVSFGGIASSSPVHFSAHMKLYTQIFTRIQN